MIGKTVGHYRVLSKVGGGGMGVVYEAEDLELDRHVALKFLPQGLAQDQGALDRFRREARATSALNHPNICTIHEIGEHEGQPYLILELLDGETLRERIARGRVPIDEVMRLGVQLADALDAAHAAGVVHRDIKPANLFVTTRGDLKVLDFGLAKRDVAGAVAAESAVPTELAADAFLTTPGTTLGTTHYMSPEQVRAEPLDARTDLFSAGTVLYELTTGRMPFTGRSAGVVFSEILNSDPTPPRTLSPEIPPALEAVLGKALVKDREGRYQSAAEMLEDLKALSADPANRGLRSAAGDAPTATFAGALDVEGPSTVVPAPQARWLWVAILLVAVLAVGSAWLTWRFGRETPADELAEAPLERRAIMVLPFENLGQAEDEYFAAGMSAEITSRLGSIEGLVVISRSSARRYADSDKTLQQIGAELDVTHVLAGSVQWVERGPGARVRISPELIRTSDEAQLWSRTIDRQVEDIFAVQGEIAEQIAASLGIELDETQRQALGVELSSSPEAYQEFLRGLQARSSATMDRVVRAIAHYERAVELDPEFAEAWAELARNRAFGYRQGVLAEPGVAEQVRREAERAVVLKPESTISQLALGYYNYDVSGNFEQAAEIYGQVAKRRPNDGAVATAQAAVYRRLGRVEESLARFARSLEIEPNRVEILDEYSFTLGAAGRFAEARSAIDKAIEIAPEIRQSYHTAALLILASSGSLEEAREMLGRIPGGAEQDLERLLWYERDFGRLVEVLEAGGSARGIRALSSPGDPERELRLGLARSRLGDEASARVDFEEAIEMTAEAMSKEFVGELDLTTLSVFARANAALGRSEEALAAVDRMLSFRQHDLWTRPLTLVEGARVYAALGETERALAHLEQVREPGAQLGRAWRVASKPVLRLEPDWDGLRQEPRFQALVAEPQGQP